jgi:hypothetical protein
MRWKQATLASKKARHTQERGDSTGSTRAEGPENQERNTMSAKMKLGTFAVLFASACSSSNGASGADASTDASASGADAAPGCDASPGAAGVTGSGQALSYGSDHDTSMPLEGVTACVLDHCEIPCVTSNSGGFFSLPGIPPGADVAITYTKAGYYSVLEATHSPTTDFALGNFGTGPSEMMTDAYAAQFFTSAGWTNPAADKGVVFVKVFTGASLMRSCTGLDQATLSASSGGTPVYGAATCTGTLDHNGAGTADPSLTATSAVGEGFFLAPPGAIDVTATHAALSCGSAFNGAGWASSKPGTVSATVRAGYITKVVQQCM